MAVRNKHKVLFWTALLLAFLTGCTQPAGDYFFISTETARAHGGHYDFTLNLDDSTGTYTVRLAARLVASRLPDRQAAFDIHIPSPVGQTTIERKSFPLEENEETRMTAGSSSVVDCEWLLKKGIRANGPDAGSWRIAVSPTDTALLDAIYGIGISYESDQGKR